jgi:hypothetical protein
MILLIVLRLTRLFPSFPRSLRGNGRLRRSAALRVGWAGRAAARLFPRRAWERGEYERFLTG